MSSSSDRHGSGFQIIAAVELPPEAVTVVIHDGPPTETNLTQAQRQQLRRAWQQTVQSARDTDKSLYDGPILHVHEVRVGRRVSLLCSQSSYSHYVAARSAHLASTCSDRQLQICPLGASVVIERSDGTVLLGRRAKTDRHVGMWGVPSGFVDPVLDAAPQGDVELARTITREAREEVGDLDIRDMVFIGASSEDTYPHPEMHFLAVASRFRSCPSVDAPGGTEFDELMVVDARPGVIRSLLLGSGPSVCPSGAASLLLYGRARFGRTWYHQLCCKLAIGPLRNTHRWLSS